MIHIFTGMWVGAMIMGFSQVGAGWDSYAIIGVTALFFYLMGHADGSK